MVNFLNFYIPKKIGRRYFENLSKLLEARDATFFSSSCELVNSFSSISLINWLEVGLKQFIFVWFDVFSSAFFFYVYIK